MQIFRKPPPPPISGWDITGDGIQNISGTGVFLDDTSGTIQSYFYLKLYDEDYPVTEGSITISATGYKKDGTIVSMGSAVYSIGSSLTSPTSRDATWASFNNSGGDGLDDYLSGTVGDGNTFNFAKRTFGEAEGDSRNFINENALDVYFEILVYNNINTSEDIDNVFLADKNCRSGGVGKVRGFDVINDDIMFVGQFGNEAPNQNGGWCFKLGDCYSNRNFSLIDGTASSGLWKPSVDLNNPSDTFGAIYTGQGRDYKCFRISGFDADGFPEFTGTSIDLAAFGSPSSTIAPTVFPNYVNSMPTILGGLNNTWSGSIVSVNDSGTYASPDYTFYNLTTGVWSDTNYSSNAMEVSGDSIYMVIREVSTSITKLAKFTFNGGDITDAANWSRFDIVDGNTNTGSLSVYEGSGDTASLQGAFFGLAIDKDEITGGFPTIYLTHRTNNFIQRVKANTSNPTGSTDFVVDVPIGNYGVTGSADGNGNNIEFNQPHGLKVFNKILYVADSENQKIRLIDIDSTSPEYLESTTGTYIGSTANKF